MHTHGRKLRKAELARHLSIPHPHGVVIYPDAKGLAKWRMDELEQSHDELHGIDVFASRMTSTGGAS